MSKKRPTESSWDSDEELLSDTSGITAFPKTSELDLLGDDGELDEDALLGMNEAGAKAVSISFANDSVRPHPGRKKSTFSRLGSTTAVEEDPVPQDDSHVDVQEFVFEEADTADLEHELIAGGEEEAAYHGEDVAYQGEDYSGYEGGGGDVSDQLIGSDVVAQDGGEEMAYQEQTEFAETSGGFEDGQAYPEDGAQVPTGETGVVLDYEQPEEQENQVHLEYADTGGEAQGDTKKVEADTVHYESESDSDDEDSRNNRGRFTSERTGVISLAGTATERTSIPDTLEINDEQAAKIEKFMVDKPAKGKTGVRGGGAGAGRGRNQNRPSVHNRLGSRNGRNQGPGLLQGPRDGPFPRPLGQADPRMQMGPRGPQDIQGLFQGALMNLRGPLTQLMRGAFLGGPQMHRALFPGGPRSPRELFPGGLNQRGPFPDGPFDRLDQRGPFAGSSIGMQSRLRGPGPFPQGPSNQRGQFPGQPRGLFDNMGPRRGGLRGPEPNNTHLSPHQRLGPRLGLQSPPRGMGLGHPNQLRGQQAQLRGQQPQMRGPMSQMGGPARQMRPGGMHQPMGMRAPGPSQPSEQGQPIPSLGKAVSRLGPSQRFPGLRPHNLGGRPQQQMGNSARQPRPLIGGLGNSAPNSRGPLGVQQGQKKHKIFINPRFQGPQGASTGITRTVRLGVPAQQRKARALLERAVQTQKRSGAMVVKVPGEAAKRRSTGGDGDPPTKVIKREQMQDSSKEVASTPMESERIKNLLEEQKRKRELIMKKKALARQRTAEAKRKELEHSLSAEGRETKSQEVQPAQAQSKPTGIPVTSRLGPPPQGSRIQTQPPPPGPRFQAQQPPGPRLQAQQSSGPRFQAQQPPGPRFQAQQSSGPRFQTQPSPGPRFQAQPSQGPRFQTQPPPGPSFQAQPLRSSRPQMPQNAQMRPPPSQGAGADFHQGPPNIQRPPVPHGHPGYQGHIGPQGLQGPPRPSGPQVLQQAVGPRQGGPSNPGAAVRYSAPPPTSGTGLRPPHPNQPQGFMQPPHLQNPPPQRPPIVTVAQPAPGPRLVRLGPPPSSQAPLPNYQITRYTAPPPVHHQPPQPIYQQPPPTQVVPSGPPPQIYSSQYPPSTPPGAPAPVPTYPTAPPNPPYPPPSNPYPQAPPTSMAYQGTDYQAPTQHYHQRPPQQHQHPPPQQQAVPSHPPQHYSQAPTSSHYAHSSAVDQHSHYDERSVQYQDASQYSYSAPQQRAIETVGSQRTIQERSPVGQRIQTIGTRVQPATSQQVRSIIHGVASARPAMEVSGTGRTVQPRSHTSDSNVSVQDGPQKILIENVPQIATRETLIKVCRHFGRVMGVNLLRDQNKAVVQFETGAQAAKCVSKCDQKNLHKTRLSVRLLPN